MIEHDGGCAPAADHGIHGLADVAQELLAAADRNLIDHGAQELLARVIEGVALFGGDVEDIQDVVAVVALAAHGDGAAGHRAQRVGLVVGEGEGVVEGQAAGPGAG